MTQINQHARSITCTEIINLLTILILLVIPVATGCSATRNVGDIAMPWPAARVTLVEPATARAGASVILAGAGFGTEAGAVSVKFGSVSAVILAISDSQLEVQVPLDCDGSLSVTINGVEAMVTASFEFLPETLSVGSFTPDTGPPGTEVVISGEGFGEIDEWVEVLIAGQPAVVLDCACDELRVSIPTGAASDVLTVRRGIQTVQTGSAFTVTEPEVPTSPPELDSFTPTAVYLLEDVRLTGANFGTDLAGIEVFVGDRQAVVSALSDTEVTARPVPGTQDGRIRIVTAGGAVETTDSLTIKPYPDYCTCISGVSADRLGPGGIVTICFDIPSGPLGFGQPVLGGAGLDYLTASAVAEFAMVYRIGEELSGEYYLGVPNKLEEADKPDGVEGDYWLNVYYEPVITVTTDGMDPPVTNGLEPGVIYGEYLGLDHACISLTGFDFTEPLAVFADGEFVDYYDGQATAEQREAYAAQGGLPASFRSPAGVFTQGEHTLTVATRTGFTTASPGYTVASVDDLDIQVTGVSPGTARTGDLVTITGCNLFWEGAGHDGLVPGAVLVGDVRLPIVPRDYLAPNSALDEMQFLVTGDACTGGIAVEIVADQYGDPEYKRVIETDLILTIDRDYLDGFDRYYVSREELEPRAYGALAKNDQTKLSANNELYVSFLEPVSYDEEHLRLGCLTLNGYTDLGRIDMAPVIFPDYSDGSGTGIYLLRTAILPDNKPCAIYNCYDERKIPAQVEYWDLRIAVYDGAAAEVYPFVLNNSEETGEIRGHLYGSVGSFDETGCYWDIRSEGLTRWTGTAWVPAGDPMPETCHYPAGSEEGITISLQNPVYITSDGHMKAFNKVINSKNDYLASYFIERQPDGTWSTLQLFDQDQEPTTWTFDRDGRARVFTNDAEKFYVHREENSFAREEWAAIPFPVGAVWPSSKDYAAADCTSMQLQVEYDNQNQETGSVGFRYSPTWGYAIPSNDGDFVVSYLFHRDEEGFIHFEPVGSYVIETSPWNLNSRRNLGLEIDTNLSGPIVMNPTGTRFTATGPSLIYELYEFDPEENTSQTEESFVAMHSYGLYVYSRDTD